MSQIHTRMPVILHQRDWARWLDRTPTDQPPVDLLRPYESDAMEMRACNPAVGNVRNHIRQTQVGSEEDRGNQTPLSQGKSFKIGDRQAAGHR
jgi:putative SOS response-associated peptidase YedK